MKTQEKNTVVRAARGLMSFSITLFGGILVKMLTPRIADLKTRSSISETSPLERPDDGVREQTQNFEEQKKEKKQAKGELYREWERA